MIEPGTCVGTRLIYKEWLNEADDILEVYVGITFAGEPCPTAHGEFFTDPLLVPKNSYIIDVLQGIRRDFRILCYTQEGTGEGLLFVK